MTCVFEAMGRVVLIHGRDNGHKLAKLCCDLFAEFDQFRIHLVPDSLGIEAGKRNNLYFFDGKSISAQLVSSMVLSLAADKALTLDACLRAIISRRMRAITSEFHSTSRCCFSLIVRISLCSPSATLLVPQPLRGNAIVMLSISSTAAGPVQPSLPADYVDLADSPPSINFKWVILRVLHQQKVQNYDSFITT
jgi:hypothetical protein